MIFYSHAKKNSENLNTVKYLNRLIPPLISFVLTWSQVTFPNWSTATYLLRWDLKTTLSPSPEGSRIQTCFFFSAFPLALVLNPNVSALRYLYFELMSPMVQHPLSVAAVVPLEAWAAAPFEPADKLPLPLLTPFKPVMAATENEKERKKVRSWEKQIWKLMAATWYHYASSTSSCMVEDIHHL